jgi:hypothetical protein
MRLSVETREELISKVREKLEKSKRVDVEHVADLATHVYRLSLSCGQQEDSEIPRLIDAFHAYVNDHKCEDAAGTQMEYAMRLIRAKGGLIYEEIHKLFYLCDQIESLKHVGMNVDEQEYRTFQEEMRKWCKRNARGARLVAEDCVEDWNENWWWYSENK